MSLYDTPDCLSRLRRTIRRDSAVDFPLDADCYAWLAEAQMEIFQWLAVYAPKACIIAPAQLVTADAGYTYTFGTDAALPTSYTDLYPIGQVQIYRALADIPDWPMKEGVEYLMEGHRIRMPDNRPFSGPAPYYQCLTLPDTLDGSVAPVLRPVQARQLLIDGASVKYQQAVGGDIDGAGSRYERSKTNWLAALQLQYANAGSVSATHPQAAPGRTKWYGRPGRGLFR
jgi:hypothetical protein